MSLTDTSTAAEAEPARPAAAADAADRLDRPPAHGCKRFLFGGQDRGRFGVLCLHGAGDDLLMAGLYREPPAGYFTSRW